MDMHITSQPVPVSRKTSFSGTIVEVVFLIVLSVITYFYLVAPKLTEFRTARKELTAIQAKKDALQKQVQDFDKLVQDFRDNTHGVNALDQVLPLDSKPSKLYVLLENFMQSSGLTTGSVTVDADALTVVAGNTALEGEASKTDHKVLPVNISVSGVGTIDQLSNLLHLVETSTRLLEINNLDVSQGRGDQVVFKVGLKAYSYGEDVTTEATATK